MNFVDEAKIQVLAGSGGNGCTAFRREKYRPKGGPSGGDGGTGGSVVLFASSRVHTLLDFKYKRIYKAQRGQHGMGRDMYGRGGEDLRIPVPMGTSVYDQETNELLADLIDEGQEYVAAHGGEGGFGNIHYATPSNQAPTRSDPGEAGEERHLRLELKLLADVGLLGLPNAGKSTLLSIVSHAKPKIANYPFTTLIPNLGVVRVDEERSFVMADIPGLVEGAHEGKGLGIRFLKHLERTQCLLHLVEFPLEGMEREPIEEVKVLAKELLAFDEGLGNLPRIIVMTKIDLCPDEAELTKWEERFKEHFPDAPFVAISSVVGKGKEALLEKVWRMLMEVRGEIND